MPVVQSAGDILELAQAENPRLAILSKAGDLSKEDVFADLVLVGIYFRPEKTKGGIYRPTDNIKEDQFQSKVGLILKMGPDCGEDVKTGDWIVYSVGDGWALSVNGCPCRLVPYERIRMRVSDPIKVF